MSDDPVQAHIAAIYERHRQWQLERELALARFIDRQTGDTVSERSKRISEDVNYGRPVEDDTDAAAKWAREQVAHEIKSAAWTALIDYRRRDQVMPAFIVHHEQRKILIHDAGFDENDHPGAPDHLFGYPVWPADAEWKPRHDTTLVDLRHVGRYGATGPT